MASAQRATQLIDEEVDQKFKALEYLLNQSKLYSTILLDQIKQRTKEEKQQKKQDLIPQTSREPAPEGVENLPATAPEKVTNALPRRSSRRSTAAATDSSGSKLTTSKQGGKKTRPRRQEVTIADYFVKKSDKSSKVELKHGPAEAQNKDKEGASQDADGANSVGQASRQPRMVKGGTMRDYQLDGLEWLASLYENGLNGILADEMGLGKTIQTISFLAYLWERQSYGPFLIVAPLSTTNNWVDEIKKWAPDLPVVLYHGTKQHRAALKQESRFSQPGTPAFPVVVTSYEMCMKDRAFLSKFAWKYIIIDEGHRLKNLNCRLIRDLQMYVSANRLLITGTPLQNNLAELWSLLHFLMPHIFDNLDAFESWFDFSNAVEGDDGDDGVDDQALYARKVLSQDRQKQLVKSLHAILRPFLLRRIKADVELNLPKKREYLLYVEMSPIQQQIYQAIQTGNVREVIEQMALDFVLGPGHNLPLASALGSKKRGRAQEDSSDESEEAVAQAPRRVRARRSLAAESYLEPTEDDHFLPSTPSAAAATSALAKGPFSVEQVTQAYTKKFIAYKRLLNPVIQLRLCCNSPYNFCNPYDLSLAVREAIEEEIEKTSSAKKVKELKSQLSRIPSKADERLIFSSGKMVLLDQLLLELIPKGHKVLIFSQFTAQLDLIETYTSQLRGWGVCRIDGSVPQSERHRLIRAFSNKRSNESAQGSDEEEEAVKDIFLLSTRAGGQGITLTAADTVILFDSDWNPQQDVQAQDRAHRIGQTRNVIVYRFASCLPSGTVPERDVAGPDHLRAAPPSTGSSPYPSSDRSSPLVGSVGAGGGVASPAVLETVEHTLLNQASSKRKLERLVIQKGGLTRSGLLNLSSTNGENISIAVSSSNSGASKNLLPKAVLHTLLEQDRDDTDSPNPSRLPSPALTIGPSSSGGGRPPSSSFPSTALPSSRHAPLSPAQLAGLLDRSDEAYAIASTAAPADGAAAAGGKMDGLLAHSAADATSVVCQPWTSACELEQQQRRRPTSVRLAGKGGGKGKK